MPEPEATTTEVTPPPIETEEGRERELRRWAERLSLLDTHPGFLRLREIIDSKATKIRQRIVSQIFDQAQAVDVTLLQRELDYERGYVDGMKYVDQVVRGAKKKMDAEVPSEEPDDEEDNWT